MRPPFSNGTAFMIWQSDNCYECRHKRNCAIYNAIGLSMAIGDVPERIAKRAGWNDLIDGIHAPPCKEKNKYKGTKKRHKKQDVTLFDEVSND